MNAVGRADDEVLAQRFRELRSTGDREVRNKLVEEHRGLAVALARRFEHRGEPLDDLVQVAMVGVLKAVERFDPDRGVGFGAFAVPTVIGELKRHFRDTTWSVRVPRPTKELHLRAGNVAATLQHELGRPPTVPEIAHALGVDVDALLEAMEAGSAYRSGSLDAPGGGEGSSTVGDLLPGDDDPAARAERQLLVRQLLDVLPERSRKVVYLRFFEDRTQTEIAEAVGISQMHVSRLLRQALALMASNAAAAESGLERGETDADAPRTRQPGAA
jgi:RNA polymerase sigma-B factor